MKEIFGIFGRKKNAAPIASAPGEDLPQEQEIGGAESGALSALSEYAAKQLETIINKMGFHPKIKAREEGEELYLEMHGEEMGRLIGKEGSTLNALQSILSAMLGKKSEGRKYVKIDANNYRVRREQTLKHMARDAAQMAIHQQKPVELEPMAASERRVIHAELSGNPEVHTYSEGERMDRRIIVAPGAPKQIESGDPGE